MFSPSSQQGESISKLLSQELRSSILSLVRKRLQSPALGSAVQLKEFIQLHKSYIWKMAGEHQQGRAISLSFVRPTQGNYKHSSREKEGRAIG